MINLESTRVEAREIKRLTAKLERTLQVDPLGRLP